MKTKEKLNGTTQLVRSLIYAFFGLCLFSLSVILLSSCKKADKKYSMDSDSYSRPNYSHQQD